MVPQEGRDMAFSLQPAAPLLWPGWPLGPSIALVHGEHPLRAVAGVPTATCLCLHLLRTGAAGPPTAARPVLRADPSVPAFPCAVQRGDRGPGCRGDEGRARGAHTCLSASVSSPTGADAQQLTPRLSLEKNEEDPRPWESGRQDGSGVEAQEAFWRQGGNHRLVQPAGISPQSGSACTC